MDQSEKRSRVRMGSRPAAMTASSSSTSAELEYGGSCITRRTAAGDPARGSAMTSTSELNTARWASRERSPNGRPANRTPELPRRRFYAEGRSTDKERVRKTLGGDKPRLSAALGRVSIQRHFKLSSSRRSFDVAGQNLAIRCVAAVEFLVGCPIRTKRRALQRDACEQPLRTGIRQHFRVHHGVRLSAHVAANRARRR